MGFLKCLKKAICCMGCHPFCFINYIDFFAISSSGKLCVVTYESDCINTYPLAYELLVVLVKGLRVY